MSALVRWEAFLKQIETRHHSVLEDGEASAREFIAKVAGGGDYQPLSGALSAIDGRLQDLESMITDTWHAKVDDAITEEGLGTAVRDQAWARGQALRYALDDAREELHPRVYAELARQRFARALAARDVQRCWCGAEAPSPVTFRAIELWCGSCGTRTLFDPGELMRSVAAVGTHAISQEACVHEWRAMRAAERALHAVRPPRPLAVIKEYERRQIAYWLSYLSVRQRFEPEIRDLSYEVRSRMEQWYVSSAEFEEAWVRAGRPREQL